MPRGAKSHVCRTETPEPIWIKNFHGSRYHRLSYPHKFWWPSVEGFLGGRGSNFPVSHWLSSSAVCDHAAHIMHGAETVKNHWHEIHCCCIPCHRVCHTLHTPSNGPLAGTRRNITSLTPIRKKDSHRQCPLRTHPLYGALSQRGLLDPISASIQPKLAGWLAQINSQHL